MISTDNSENTKRKARQLAYELLENTEKQGIYHKSFHEVYSTFMLITDMALQESKLQATLIQEHKWKS